MIRINNRITVFIGIVLTAAVVLLTVQVVMLTCALQDQAEVTKALNRKINQLGTGGGTANLYRADLSRIEGNLDEIFKTTVQLKEGQRVMRGSILRLNSDSQFMRIEFNSLKNQVNALHNDHFAEDHDAAHSEELERQRRLKERQEDARGVSGEAHSDDGAWPNADPVSDADADPWRLRRF